ncbi:hypothetical protein [Nannocystis sp.]|uniref:hypothetical protein n=1 Tax=Nannocystis sp. TaxID=1962667 RepID=UPI0025FF393E|nr:hypothetical protein [Nannocystis sp.]MBK7825049.1 hypothetical protein [Nannocystis sp.]
MLEQAIAATGSEATANLIRARVAVWKGDRVFAGFTADRIDIVTPPDHFTRAMIEPLRAFARGERVKQTLDELLVTAGSMSAASLKVFWCRSGSSCTRRLG